jgi:signal transduction histidine kinase
MTLRLRLLLWLAPLAALLVGFMVWFALRQTASLEFVKVTSTSQIQTPVETPKKPVADLAKPTAPVSSNPNPFVSNSSSPAAKISAEPAVPTPKSTVVQPPTREITLAQLQTRREPALLRFSAGQLEEVRASDGFTITNQSTIWLWAILLLSTALLFGSVGVRRSLIPLERFAADIASRNANQLEAIANPPLPELKPAVHAFNGLLEDLRTSLSRARLQEQSAKRFAYNASHELRNPLTAARNYLEVLERHPNEPLAVAQALEAVRRTERVLGSLLTLARLEGRGQVTGQTVALKDFLEANFELPVEGNANIIADRDLLELAIENLVKNADDHGGGATRFVLESNRQQTWIWLEDTGIGFAPDLLPTVFEPFVKRGHGTGLGLAIVAAIADVHGGQTRAENLAKGARVGIGFPNG